MKKALVLGGGGIVGVAWETAILAGLMDGGVDVRDAGVIVGTSAGSIVGTAIARGQDPRDLLRESRARAGDPPPAGRMPTPAEMAPAFRTWASSDEMTPEACAAIGRAALATPTMTESEYIARFSNADQDWPQKPLLVTAVDCESGEGRVFDAQSGVPIHLAIAASCSVPGMFPPVTIEGRRYTDGGVRSGTSADLVGPFAPDVVLVLAPMGGSGSRLGEQIARTMGREIAGLESVGADVRLVQFDDAARAAGAGNLMNAAEVTAASAAGEAHGHRLAAEIADRWK